MNIVDQANNGNGCSTTPYPEKEKMGGHLSDDVVVAVDDDFLAGFDGLSVDVLANILEFLLPKEIMRQRRVCRECTEAATKTIVPLTDFCVGSIDEYDAMVVMTRAMPNLRQIQISRLERGHKYSDGEDPDQIWAAAFANLTSHDIEIISNFNKLRILDIDNALLNGRYPFLFNSFPLLQKLTIKRCHLLTWDLEMLSGLPMLKELYCSQNFKNLTGNIKSLRVLKGTLQHVTIDRCENVEGNFMDLADFPHLNELNLTGTAVTGDIRDIGENDFSSLEHLILPKSVYGGRGYEFQRISDAPDLIRAVYLLKKQRPFLEMKDWYMRLSEDSPDWYESVEDFDKPPFFISFVKAGSRLGYRWKTNHGRPCEVNWLDPEPDRESSDYDEYIEKLQSINSEADFYNGFYQPPTEEEYRRLFFTG